MKKLIAILLAILVFISVMSNVKALSPSAKMKGICVHGEDIYKEGAGNVIQKLKEYGYNTIFLLIKNPGGEVYYKSNFMPVKYPILNKTIEAARQDGMKVFVYFPVFMDENYGKMHPEEQMVRVDGTRNSYYISFLSDNYFQYLKRFLSELSLFDIDGIVFDYIRFPNGSYDFSNAFESLALQKGIDFDSVKDITYKTFINPADWKSLFYKYDTDENIKKWVNLRKQIVQNEAYILKNYVNALNPHIRIGAFIVARGFQYKIGKTDDIKKTYEYEIANFGQSPDTFTKLDFIIPMVYLNSLRETPQYAATVAEKMKNSGNEAVYIAINPYGISSSDTEKELFYAFSRANGAVLFRYPIFQTGIFTVKGSMEPSTELNVTVETSSGDINKFSMNTGSKNFIPEYKNTVIVSPFYQYVEINLYIGKKEGFKTALPFYKDKSFLMDTAPFIKDNRTFVPIRFVSENLGAKVYWDGGKREVKIESRDKLIIVKIGSKKILVNGKSLLMDTAPFIKDNRTFVPIRFVSENLGAKVYWDGGKREVKIEKFNRID